MRRRIGLAVCALIAGLGACTSAGAAVASPVRGLLGHHGRWITDAEGRVVLLHGLNMVNKRPSFTPAGAGFGTVAATALQTNGFDVVRLGVLYEAVEPRPGVIDRAYLRSIAKTVAQLARRGVYTLLDFHQDQMSEQFGGEGFPSWSVLTDGLVSKPIQFPFGYAESPALNRAFANLWADAPGPGGVGLQERYVAGWEAVAKVFTHDPWVAGYDLFNEPWPGGGTDAQLTALYAKIIGAIRSVGDRHLIFYEPYVTFDLGTPAGVTGLPDAALGMSFHDYCLLDASTHAPQCAASEAATIRSALAQSSSTGVALMLTEFGATNTLSDLQRVQSLADADQLSWIEWAYCGCDDPTGSVPPSIEALVTDPATPATGANVRLAKLRALAEPYAPVVAGTPERQSFDRGDRTYRVTYSTTAPDGRRFGAGACTAVVVPPVQYPTGYRVRADGATVISAPGSGLLLLRASGKARVSVEIAAAQGGRTTAPTTVPATCR